MGKYSPEEKLFHEATAEWNNFYKGEYFSIFHELKACNIYFIMPKVFFLLMIFTYNFDISIFPSI